MLLEFGDGVRNNKCFSGWGSHAVLLQMSIATSVEKHCRDNFL